MRLFEMKVDNEIDNDLILTEAVFVKTFPVATTKYNAI